MVKAELNKSRLQSHANNYSRNKLLLYLSLCLFFVILLIPPGFSQQDENFGWTAVDNSVSTNLNDVVSIDSTQTVAVGDNGIIVSTEDEGITWNQELLNEQNNLKSISMHNNTFFVVGDAGTVYRKIFGEPWEFVTSFTGVDLYSVSHISTLENSFDNSIVYAGGQNGELWKSVNGGNSWIIQDLLVTNDINGIDFHNSSHGILVGSNAMLMGTTNGGNLWETRDVPDGISSNLRSVVIVNFVRMYAVGDNGAFIKSSGSNIGWTWTKLNASTTADLYGVAASSINKIYAVGTNGVVVNSVNGGSEFVFQKVQTSVNNSNFLSIDVSDSENGWIVGENGVNLVTTTGGVALRDVPTVEDLNDWSAYLDFALPILFEGFQNMVEILVISIAMGFILGLLIAVIRTSRSGYINPRLLLIDLNTHEGAAIKLIWRYIISVFHYIVKSLAVA